MLDKFEKFWDKYSFHINLIINMFGLAVSISYYWDEQYKEAYQTLVATIFFVLFDLFLRKFGFKEEPR